MSKLVAFTTLILLLQKLIVKLHWYIMLSKLKIQYRSIRSHIIEFFKKHLPQDFNLPALQPYGLP